MNSEMVLEGMCTELLNTTPQILHSDYLSRITGLNVWILDYSCTDVGTHKLEKAIKTIEKSREKDNEVILFINPVIDSRKNSNGSGIDALELACAVYSPETQVVSVVHSNKPYFHINPIHSDFPDSRQRLEIGINLSKFWRADRLEDLFNHWMSKEEDNEVKQRLKSFVQDYDKNLIDFRNSNDVRNILKFFKNKKINPEKCLAGTNLSDFCDEEAYHYSNSLIEELEESYVVGSVGTGERAEGQLKAFEDSINVFVFPTGHAVEPLRDYQESVASRVQTPYKIKTHYDLIQKSIGKNVIFKATGNLEAEMAEELLKQAIIKDNLKIETSKDGAISFSLLKNKYNPKHSRYFANNGILINNTYHATKEGLSWDGTNQNIMPYDAKVCIINTGRSNNYQLKKLIEKGMVK